MHARKGFTLVEMMVALALGVIIAGVVATVFRQASGLFTLSRARTEVINNARVAMKFIEADIISATLVNGQLFLGIRDGALRGMGVDNDGDYSTKGFDEDPTPSDGVDNDNDGREDEDPYDFTYDDGADGIYKYLSSDEEFRYRSGVELLTTSMFAFAPDGQQASWAHVLYYLTQDYQVDDRYTVGRLIRYSLSDATDLADPVSFLDPSGPLNYRASLTEKEKTGDPDDDLVSTMIIAFGVVRLRMRFFDQTNQEWVNRWDTDDEPFYPAQYQTLPQLVQVELTVIDTKNVLAREGNNPYVLSRIIEVGTTTAP